MRFLVVGAGGFSCEVGDLLSDLGHGAVAFYSDSPEPPVHMPTGLPVVSSFEIDAEAAVIAIGDSNVRERMYALLQGRFQLPALVHPSAVVSSYATIGDATLIMPFTSVSARAHIGKNVLLNVGCYVAHDCVVGDHTHLASGVRLGGYSRVGERCLCGTSMVLLPGRSVGDAAVCGAGCVVTRDVEPGVTVVGVPARPLAGRREDRE